MEHDLFEQFDFRQTLSNTAFYSYGPFLPEYPASPLNAGFCVSALHKSPREGSPMHDLYSSHAAELRDALRHAVERGGMSSSLGVLHQGVPSASTLTGTDATAQAARIRRQLERLAPVPRALLVVAYASRALKCSCGARHCGQLSESRMVGRHARAARARAATRRSCGKRSAA